MSDFWVYMMTNKPHGTLYVGVTNNLSRRVWEHKEALVEGFTKRYNLKRLVWFEEHATTESALMREYKLKRWKRAWKDELIEAVNPEWDDLYDSLLT